MVERAQSRKRLTDAPPTFANLGDAGFPLGGALEDIRAAHERPDLTDFELRGRTAKLLDFKSVCLLKSREVRANRLGSDAVHWNFRGVRRNGKNQASFTMRPRASLHAGAAQPCACCAPVTWTQVTAPRTDSLGFQTLAGHA